MEKIKDKLRWKLWRIWRKIIRIYYIIKLWNTHRINRKWNCECCGRKRDGERKYCVERKFICADCQIIYNRDHKL